MPELARFYGISIKMFFRNSEHNPPHIHAQYNSHIAIINIETLKVIEGKLPKKALELVIEWVTINQSNLLKIWNTQHFIKIQPLD